MVRRPIQLLIVIIDLVGGTGTFCRSLAKGLKKCVPGEFQISLLVLRGEAPIGADEFDQVHSLNSEVHRNWRRWIEAPFHVLRLRRRIKGIDPDLILTVNTYSNLLVPVAAPRRRIVLSVHSNSNQQLTESRFPRTIRRRMLRTYPKHTLVAPTEGVAKDLADNFGISGARVIPHGVDLAAIRSQAAQQVDLPEKPYMIALGRLTSAKDYPTMLRAYSAIQPSGIEEDLVIIGGGELRDELTRLRDELGLTQRVHFLGHQPNPFPYIREARFFVMSSIWEGFGLALLEAMALGKPSIATDCPSGPAEILDHGEFGLVVQPRDVQGLADAILEMSGSLALRDSFAYKATQRAEELSLERMALAYRDLFLRELES